MIDKKLLEVWNNVREQNDKLIQITDDILPVCIIVNKDYSQEIIGFRFRNSTEKQIMKKILMNIIVTKSLLGYILIQDTKMTCIDEKTGKHKVDDAIIRQLFTPKEQIIEAVVYKDKKILEKIEMNDGKSEWNLWTMGSEMNKDSLDKYNKIKKENPDDYKSVI